MNQSFYILKEADYIKYYNYKKVPYEEYHRCMMGHLKRLGIIFGGKQ